VGYSTTAKNAMLQALATIATHASLHSSDPGIAGANEISGGDPPYARQSITWNVAADGQVTLANDPIFNVPPGSIPYLGFQTAASGGTFLGSGLLSPAPEEFTAQGLFKVTSAILDLNALGGVDPEMAMTALMPQLAGDLVGLLVPQGVAASTLPQITAEVSGMLIPLGAVAGTVPSPTGSLVGDIPGAVAGLVAANIPSPSAELSGMFVPVGDLAGTLPALVASVAGVRVDQGTMDANLSALTASVSGEFEEAGGGATLPASDDFNRADGSLGSNWVDQSGESSPRISSNKFAAASGGAVSGAVWDVDANNNQWAMAQFFAGSTPDWPPAPVGPRVRCSGSQRTFYGIETSYDGEYDEVYFYLVKYVNGTRSEIGSPGIVAGVGGTARDGGYVRIEASGTTITVKYHASNPASVSTIISGTDSGIASGRIGCCASSSATADNFSGGNL
jgi:hypothetical protein